MSRSLLLLFLLPGALQAQPTITSFTPTSGNVGASVTITGTNFSATAANNTVFFGAVKATVTAASTTSLTVTVPTGATFGPVSVQVANLTAFSPQFFLPTFAGTGSTIDASNLAAKVDFTAGSGPYSVAIGDVDGDGKPDLAVPNINSATISVFRNQTLIVPPAPALSSPADGATGQALSPTLSWSAASGATAYRLQVSTVSNFASTVFDNAALTGTSQGVGPLSFNTLYYWQVRGSNANGAGAFSTARSFTTVATAQMVAGNEDADLTITLSGTDVDGQTLRALISALPVNGSLYQTADGTTRGTQISSVPTTVTDASKRVIYAPPANGNGAGHGNFGFKVNDGAVDSPEATVTVNVTAINDAPTLTAIADPAAILEDAGAQTINLSGIGTGAANETQVLTVTATSSNTALIPHPTVTYTSPNATGTLSYTPVSQASGTATITVTVTDDGGTASGGMNTVAQSFTVTVNPVNTVAAFVMSHHNPVHAGDRIDLSVSFRNPFGRMVPYTGSVRLAVADGRILGAGVQSVSAASTVVFPLHTQVFRTAEGSAASIPFRVEVEGVGSQAGTFQVISRFLIPTLVLPLVEVRQGESWVDFARVAFIGGRTQRLRVRNPNAVAARIYLEVVFTPFAVDGRGATSDLAGTTPWTVRFGRTVERLDYTPAQEGHTVFLFDGPRPHSQYVAIGLRVQEGSSHSRLVGVDQARVEVVYSDGHREAPAQYQVWYSSMRAARQEDGSLVVFPQGAWDAPSRTRTRWLSRPSRIGLGSPSLGLYVSPSGERRVDYLFPYVVEVLPAAKPVGVGEEVGEELQALMGEWVAGLPAVAELWAAWDQGERELPSLDALPARTGLAENFPNPFNPFTQIVLALAEEGKVRLSIYNLLGQEVRILGEGYWPAGGYQVEWDGRDEEGNELASGIYFCRLQVAEQMETRKLLLLR